MIYRRICLVKEMTTTNSKYIKKAEEKITCRTWLEKEITRIWFYLTKPNENAWSVHIFIWFDAMCGCICVKNNLIEKKERKKDSEIQADTILLTFLYNLRSIIQVFGHKFSVFFTFCVLLFFFYRRMYEQKERRNVRKRKNKWNKIKY